MKRLLLVMCICNLWLPVEADVEASDLYTAVGVNAILNTSVDCHWKLFKKDRKHKIAYLDNGNIIVDGKEYAPVDPDHIFKEAKAKLDELEKKAIDEKVESYNAPNPYFSNTDSSSGSDKPRKYFTR